MVLSAVGSTTVNFVSYASSVAPSKLSVLSSPKVTSPFTVPPELVIALSCASSEAYKTCKWLSFKSSDFIADPGK